MKVPVTSGVVQDINPHKWREHRFGLSSERWRYLGGKSFWITGSGTGYGRCLAVALAATGGTVFLSGRRKEKLEETIHEMHSLEITADKCHLLDADITDSNQVREASGRVMSLCDSLYGLVNNAALPPNEHLHDPLQDGTLEEWDRIMRTNVTAPWLVTKTIFPHMKKGGAVRVLFMTSEAGWAFTPGFGPYNISKAALNNLAASMAKECATSFPDTDIQINTLVPGEARTEMNRNSSESPYSIVNMALLLLSSPAGGPNGKFFHRDGRHLQFAYSLPYEQSLRQERLL